MPDTSTNREPAPDIPADARWLLQAYGQQAQLARLVALGPEGYREASFLDDRLFQRKQTAIIRPWSEVARQAEQVGRADAGWIFHIGHVGSTLISRLLGEMNEVLAVREPRSLRDLAAVPADQRSALVPAFTRLFSRVFAGQRRAVVKATSFVSELAADLCGEHGTAVLLRVTPLSYITTILAGPNSTAELRSVLAARQERLAGRVPGWVPYASSSDAELAAHAWACEATALEVAAERLGSTRASWCDFDAFLADLPGELSRVAGVFGLAPEAERIGAIVTGPLLNRYSKALEYDYSPQLRSDLQDQARREHDSAIRQAMERLAQAAEGAPLLARALARKVEA